MAGKVTSAVTEHNYNAFEIICYTNLGKAKGIIPLWNITYNDELFEYQGCKKDRGEKIHPIRIC